MLKLVEDDEGLVPSTVLPEQLIQRCVPRTPERQLMIAVLQDAFHIYCKFASWPQHRRFRETARWFASTDRIWLFSFERICDVLDLNPRCVRRCLQARRSLPKNASGAREAAGRSLLAAAGG
jgi:hypothetical protein